MGTMTYRLRLTIAAAIFAGLPAAADAVECKSLGIHFLGDSWASDAQDGSAVPVRGYLVDVWREAGNPSYSRVYVEMKTDDYKPGMAFEFERVAPDGAILMKEKMSLVPRATNDLKFLDYYQVDIPRLERMAGPLPEGVSARDETLRMKIRLRRDTICTQDMKIDMKAR